ncbi:MAG: thiamine-phosphate kinase, partial [Stellaceae bacterium]
LLADLGHICETSGVAAIVALDTLPLSAGAQKLAASDSGLRAQLAAGGDDYELLFTASPADTGRIAALSKKLALPIAKIGRIEAGAGVRLVDSEGRTIPVEHAGWRHF